MVQKINFQDFVDGFKKAGRENQFSYDALKLIFEFMEEIEEVIEKTIEYDVIGICCDFSEYTLKDFNNDFETDFESLDEVEKYLSFDTTVIGKTEDSIVFQNY